MERNEFQVMVDEVRSLIAEGRTEEAAGMLDGAGWSKLHNVAALTKGAELYEQTGRLEDARELLLLAHERSPIGRMPIYHLAMVSLKMGEVQKAQDYYDEFLEIAPHDSLRFVIRYRLAQANGASDEALIAILEELKDEDFLEDWALELAALYQKTGQIDKCTDLCDEIIVWFGEGPYVEKALELKRLYRPLDASQEERLRRIKSQDMQELTPESAAAEAADDMPSVPIPSPRFNTLNLQQEIEKNIEEILHAKSTESVTENMEAIKELVDTMPYLQVAQDTQEVRLARSEEEERRAAEALRTQFAETLREEEASAEAAKAEETAVPAEEAPADPEAAPAGEAAPAEETPKLSMDDVLDEWERTRKAAEAALEAAEEEKLASAKEQALAEANEILARLAAIIPKLEAGATHEELITGEPAAADGGETAPAPAEPAAAEEAAPAAQETPAPAAEEAAPAAQAAPAVPAEEAPAEEPVRESEEPKRPTGHTQRMPRLFEQPKEVTPEEEQKGLTADEMRYFSNFASIEGIEEQLADAVRAMRESILDPTQRNACLLICGKQASGKSALAVNILKLLQEETHFPKGPVGKVDGDQLNGKDIFQLFDRIRQGALIIERAGGLDRTTVAALNALLDTDKSGVMVVAEDDAEGLETMLSYNPAFASRFDLRIDIPSITIDELVNFARTYAEENHCRIDEMGVLALYNHLNLIQRQGTLLSMGTVRNIVDDAITRANQGGLFGLVGRIGTRHRDDAGRLLLHEKDFEK